MVVLTIGILLMALAVFACFPPLNWWADILAFLRGSLPVLALLIGFVAVFIGIADIKDKKEEAEEKSAEGGQGAEKDVKK
jgi:hypothetical protein